MTLHEAFAAIRAFMVSRSWADLPKFLEALTVLAKTVADLIGSQDVNELAAMTDEQIRAKFTELCPSDEVSAAALDPGTLNLLFQIGLEILRRWLNRS